VTAFMHLSSTHLVHTHTTLFQDFLQSEPKQSKGYQKTTINKYKVKIKIITELSETNTAKAKETSKILTTR